MRITLALILLISPALQVSSAKAVERNWCGVYGDHEIQISPTDELVKALVIFVAFQPNINTPLPAWADDLNSDFSEYLKTMSGNGISGLPIQNMEVTVARRPGPDSNLAWIAPHEASYYNSRNDFEHSTGKANYDVVEQVVAANPSVFSGIEVIFMLHYECTAGFLHCGTDSVETASPVLGFDTGPYEGAMVQMESIPGKEVAEIGLMHEYLHKVGLDHPPHGGETIPPIVHYGRYDAMTGTQDGLSALPDGLVPVHPFELMNPDNQWAPPFIPISSSTLDVEVPDFFGTPARLMRKTYMINPASSPAGTTQTFFLVNHQGTTPFDSKYGGTGLLIWHLLAGDAPVARDLEAASGKFNPYPNGPADQASGEDALEAYTSQNPYLGSAADFFDGASVTDFSYATNPNTDLYAGSDYFDDPQDFPSGVAIENIRQEANGKMKVDIYLTKAQLIESPGAPGESAITRGSTVQINWRVRPLLSATTVDIEIAESATGPFRPLASGVPNTGTFSWPVLQKEGSDYRLKLITRGPGGSPHILGTDISDNPIEIDDNRSCPP